MTDQTPTTETMTDATPEHEVMDEQATEYETSPAITEEHENDVTEDVAESEHDDEQASDKLTNEAAKYRRRLRETEAERDILKQTVESLQRREVERLAGDRLSQPGDIFDLGRVTIADLVNEEGHVEPALVDTAIMGLLDSRPGLAKPAPTQKFPSAIGLGNRGPITPAGKSWQDVISGGTSTQAR